MCLVNKQWRDVCYTYPSIRRKIVLTKAEYQDDKVSTMCVMLVNLSKKDKQTKLTV